MALRFSPLAPAGTCPEARVVFELAVEDGWPPVGSERVWAHHLGGDRYRIANAPWFVRDLAVGDVVRAQAPGSGSHPVCAEVVERSGHVTIRLICYRRGPLGVTWRERLSRSRRSASTEKGCNSTACWPWISSPPLRSRPSCRGCAKVSKTVHGSTRKVG
jgi:hypothetical protein